MSRKLLLSGVAGAAVLGAGLGLWARPAELERNPQPARAQATAAAPKRLQIVVDDAPAPIGAPIEVLPAALAASAPAPGAPAVARQAPHALVKVGTLAGPQPPEPAEARSFNPIRSVIRVLRRPLPRRVEAPPADPAEAQEPAIGLRKVEAAPAADGAVAEDHAAQAQERARKARPGEARAAAKAARAQKAEAARREKTRQEQALAEADRQAAAAKLRKTKLEKAKLEKARLEQAKAEARRNERRQARVEKARAEKVRTEKAAQEKAKLAKAQAVKSEKARLAKAKLDARKKAELAAAKRAPKPAAGAVAKVETRNPRGKACASADAGEALVCADPALSAADRRMNQAYRQAQAAGVPEWRLREQQQRWRAARAVAARDAPWQVREVYLARIAELNDMARDAQREAN